MLNKKKNIKGLFILLFQIISKKTRIILSDKLTLNQLLEKISYQYHQELDSFLDELSFSCEKEFIIKAAEDINWIKNNPKNFTVIVKRLS